MNARAGLEAIASLRGSVNFFNDLKRRGSGDRLEDAYGKRQEIMENFVVFLFEKRNCRKVFSLHQMR